MLKRAKSILVATALTAMTFMPVAGLQGLQTSASAASATPFPDIVTQYANINCSNGDPVTVKDGCSLVNLNWKSSLPTEKLKAYLDECKSLGVNAIVSLHDAEGQKDIGSLEKCVDFWLQDDVANIIKNYSATIEVASGWDPADLKVWQSAYQSYLPKINDFYKGGSVCVSTPSCTEFKTASDATKALNESIKAVASSLSGSTFVIDEAKTATTLINRVHVNLYDIYPVVIPNDISLITPMQFVQGWDGNALDAIYALSKAGCTELNLKWATSLPIDKLDKYLAVCDNLKMRTFVTLEDANGKSDLSAFTKCVNFWMNKNVVKVMNNHKNAVLSVAAGWDPGNFNTWESTYEKYMPSFNSVYTGKDICISTPSCDEFKDANVAARIVSGSMDKIASCISKCSTNWDLGHMADCGITVRVKIGPIVITVQFPPYFPWEREMVLTA